MSIEEKEEPGFFVPLKKKVKREKKLLPEEPVFEPADEVWDDEVIPTEIEEQEIIPEKEDESLPI